MFSSRVVPDRVRFPALLELELEPTNQPRSGDEITEGALAKKKVKLGYLDGMWLFGTVVSVNLSQVFLKS